MGPHGLVIGATGSGKSEFLRTLVLGLTMTHSPEQLNLVLVDFKGGATFAGMSGLPHVSAMITNLAQELTLVDRMQDALSGEMVRRQELLREAGNFASIRDYEKARAGRRGPGPAAVAVHRGRRVLRDAVGQARVHRPVRGHRPARPLARPAPAARLPAARGGPPARPGVAPLLPGRPADLQRPGVPHGARRPRRLRAPAGARPRLPEAGPDLAGAVQGGVRLRSADRPGAGTPRRGRQAPGHPPLHDLRGAQARRRGARGRARAAARRARRAGHAARHRGRAHGRQGPGRPPGVAAAARRAGHPRPADARPGGGPAARAGVAGVAAARRAHGAARDRRPAARAAPRHPERRPVRARPATSRSSAGRAAARARCCARSSRAWR